MPLLECPDCNNLVSDLAAACPKCGRPTGSKPALAAAAKRLSIGSWIGCVFLIILTLVLVWMLSIIWD